MFLEKRLMITSRYINPFFFFAQPKELPFRLLLRSLLICKKFLPLMQYENLLLGRLSADLYLDNY